MAELCERRLDSVVRHAGLTATRPQARQSVSQGHFLLNGYKTNVPSALVRAGDVTYLKRRPNQVQVYSHRLSEFDGIVPDWIEMDAQKFSARVLRLPDTTGINLPVENHFLGLGLDEANEPDLTQERIHAWLMQVVTELGFNMDEAE